LAAKDVTTVTDQDFILIAVARETITDVIYAKRAAFEV
jgi:hypothetical protein